MRRGTEALKRVRLPAVAAAILFSLAGVTASADDHVIADSKASAKEPARALQVLATVGPWPVLSALIGYRGRVWFANSVRYPDHNSADIYSLDPATGNTRYERHLFTQDVGIPVVAGGLLYWPYEDPRPSMGWGHIAVTDGKRWQLRVMPDDKPMFHVHAMENMGGRLYAAPSAWRAGLHVSTDGGHRWRRIYDHPTPRRQVTRIVALAGFGGRLFGSLIEYRQGTPRHPLLVLDGSAVTQVPGWPETARTLDLIATKNGVHGLVRGENGEVAFWRTDGRRSERLDEAGTMPPLEAVAAAEDGFWGVGDAPASIGTGGVLWHSKDGRRWRRVQDLEGGRPVDVMVYHGNVYVSGAGADGRGIVWGPPSPSLATPPGAMPVWPSWPPSEMVDWKAAGAAMNNAISKPDTYRTRLRDLAYRWARAAPPPGFIEAALDSPFPDSRVAMFGGGLRPKSTNLGRHILLWSMGVSGRGQVPRSLLERPWTRASNRPQKWFDSLPMALFAVSWTGQDDRRTVASLIGRLNRANDPKWLKGDIIGALSAATGKRFGYDLDAWRRWWAAEAP